MIGYNNDFDWTHYYHVTKTSSGQQIDNTSNLIYGTEFGSPPQNGNDLIVAGSGNDRIYGNGGNDVIAGGAGNDAMNGGFGNDLFFFEKGSGNDVITDFGHSLGNLDQIVVDGKYLSASSSFLGTTLKFDYNNDGNADGSVLLAGVSGSAWQRYLADGALIDSTKAPVEVAAVDSLVHHYDLMA